MWGKKRAAADAGGDAGALLEAKAMCTLYDSLRLAHKYIPTPPLQIAGVARRDTAEIRLLYYYYYYYYYYCD